jgi:DNA-binding PadR family transcriptional regulator
MQRGTMVRSTGREPPSRPDHAPLSSAAFYTLFALAEDEAHGYAIMQAVKSLSGSGFSMGPATLYTTIGRLLQARLIKETTNEKPVKELGRGRRFYKLTALGRAAFDEELRRMAHAIKRAKLDNLVPGNADGLE